MSAFGAWASVRKIFEDLAAADLAAFGSKEGLERGALVGIEPVEVDRLDTRFAGLT